MTPEEHAEKMIADVSLEFAIRIATNNSYSMDDDNEMKSYWDSVVVYLLLK